MQILGFVCLGTWMLLVHTQDVGPEEIQEGLELVQAVYKDSERIQRESLSKLPMGYKREEVCFPEIGCFSKVDGPFDFTSTMPETPEQIGTTFSLFTLNNPTSPVLLSYNDKSTLTTSLLDLQLPLAVITHGLNEYGEKKWITDLRTALLRKGYGNVVVVDWSKGCPLPFYGQAMVNSEVVGRQLAYILELLHMTRGLRLDNVHLLGYSLGAHVSGFAGKTIMAKLGQQIGRITGLDPAGPSFENKTAKTHLSYLDATYVDVVHTSAGKSILSGDLGIVKPIGHADFYPNGGRDQPGCGFFDITCSHRRGYELFLESTGTSPCVFSSYPCVGGYQDYKAGKCKDCGTGGCGALGFHSHRHPGRGSLYLHTKSAAPYCIHASQT